ncbi:MAG: AraC family ligand binding domain-containing protein, partial [Clostridia bacterium]|nr:AraC family ligand binding domain-containing protein [Clostridia bacterium]
MRDYKSEMTYFLQDFYIERELKPLPVTMPVSHYHSYYEIYYLTKGNVRYFIDNTTYDLSAGDIVLIPPNIIHKTSVIDDGSSERLLIWFTADFLEKNEDDHIFDCFKKHHIKNVDAQKIILSSIETE